MYELCSLLKQGLQASSHARTTLSLGDRSKYVGLSDIGKAADCLRTAVAGKVYLPQTLTTATPCSHDTFLRTLRMQRGHWFENGITEGTSDTTFAPGTICTRAQGAALLYRAAGSPAVSGSAAFTDVPADAYYADAATWAEQKGITGGIGNGLFGPHNNCTRAQIVTFLYRMYGSK